ncbi:hypothetical protein ABN154_05440 [Klebsiella michiganensis]|uniref:hypothetical protein n=1 Tax=Klebsiella michiganensis TaxID=1134687 RepID=UPI0032DB52BE
MKNQPITVWYCVAFMVTENAERREYSIFVGNSSEMGAVVFATNGLCKLHPEFSEPAFKSIRIATYGEAESLDAELDAIAEREEKELEEEGDE